MNTNEFIDTTAPDDLYRALEPIAPPAGQVACRAHNPRLFASPGRQQAAFDGEPVDPVQDYRAARMVCLGCPVLSACTRYAEASGEANAFLAGMSSDQRRAAPGRKKAEIAGRRQRVAELRRLGASTAIIADLVGRDPSLIRADLRVLEQTRSAVRSRGNG